MNKKIVAGIVLAIIGVFVVADLAKSDDSTTAPTHVVTNSPTTASDSAERAFCTQKATEAADLMSRYAEILPSVTTVTEAKAALETGRALVEMGNAWLNRCESLFPAQATQIRSTLNDFSVALDRLEAVL